MHEVDGRQEVELNVTKITVGKHQCDRQFHAHLYIVCQWSVYPIENIEHYNNLDKYFSILLKISYCSTSLIVFWFFDLPFFLILKEKADR